MAKQTISKKPFYEHNVRDIIQQWQSEGEDSISFSRMVELLNGVAGDFYEAKKPVKESAYADCIDTYNNFIIQQTGLPGKFDGAEGKAMKAIIKYLESITKEKSTQDTINAFNVILQNIGKWEPFHQKQLKLQQINSNLINIINAIKNGNKTANTYDKSIYR